MQYGTETIKPPIVLAEGIEEGIKFVILNLGTHPTSYISVPIDHPLAGFHRDTIPISVHGGFTYSGKGDGKYLPKNYYWYGWDYGHSGDYAGYSELPQLKEHREKYKDLPPDKKWTTEELLEEMWHAIYEFSKLKELTEKISNKV